MKELNLSLFWIITAPCFLVWALGIYLVVKGWTTKREAVAVGLISHEEVRVPKEETRPEEKIKPKKEFVPEKETIEIAEIEIGPQVPKEETRSAEEEFYKVFGKPNLIEFPAEYIDEYSVKGLDGKETGFLKFAASCYTQIGFRCVETIFTRRLADRTYRVSIFDLISDHYTLDEQDYIDFFGENKDRFSDEIASIKSYVEFAYENMKELSAVYEGLPQLLAWDDKEMFVILVKSKNEELAQKEIAWFKETALEKGLIKAKIFRITEKKVFDTPSLAKTPPFRPKPVQPIQPVRPAALAEREKEKVTKKHFSKEEIDFLNRNRGMMTNEEMARRLGRSTDSVTHKLSRLGIARESFVWTKLKESFLKNNFNKLSYQKLAWRLGTTVPSVRARCKKMGLKK